MFRRYKGKFLRSEIAALMVGTIMLGAMAATPAHAYVLAHFYQKNNWNILYCNHASGNSWYAYSGAINAWNVSSASVYFTVNCSGAIDNLYSEDAGATGWDGLNNTQLTSTYPCNGWQAVTESSTELNTHYTDNQPYNGGARQSVAAHELGHSVGVTHATGSAPPAENTLMYFSTDRYWVYGIDVPTTDEGNGVNYVYSKC